jgi:hypothetical protein
MKRRTTKRSLCRQLLLHLLMGACLGLLFALVLLVADLAHLREFFSVLPNPGGATMSFVLGLSLMFALGATLTGYMFITADD